MDRIEAMRSFVHVVDSGSFTQAAARLGRNKTTVSDQVARLESSLGVSLLTRITRTVVPTAEGLQYARKASAILAQFDEAESALKTRIRNPQGVLRVEMPSPIGHALVIPQIHSFLTQYPRITLDLNCTDRISDLVREGVDCVLRGGSCPTRPWSAESCVMWNLPCSLRLPI
jgi:LysR family transcriptional regulator, regulator for bpeEF and oprC